MVTAGILSLTGNNLKCTDLIQVAELELTIKMTATAMHQIRQGRDLIEAHAAEHEVYGFSTGVGVLKKELSYS